MKKTTSQKIKDFTKGIIFVNVLLFTASSFSYAWFIAQTMLFDYLSRIFFCYVSIGGGVVGFAVGYIEKLLLIGFAEIIENTESMVTSKKLQRIYSPSEKPQDNQSDNSASTTAHDEAGSWLCAKCGNVCTEGLFCDKCGTQKKI